MLAFIFGVFRFHWTICLPLVALLAGLGIYTELRASGWRMENGLVPHGLDPLMVTLHVIFQGLFVFLWYGAGRLVRHLYDRFKARRGARQQLD